MITAAASLRVYGFEISVEGDWGEVVELVRRDWAWFEVDEPAERIDVAIRISRRRPDFGAFGPLVASFVTPRNVVYQDGNRTIVDYFGRAAACFDRDAGSFVVEGEDEHLVHEAVWLFLLSLLGAHVESLGLPRLHALGLAGPQGAVAILLGSGGGKSKLAVRALDDNRVRLLSDDMPLLDRRGFLHPFPLGISVNTGDAADLPEGDLRGTDRMEFHSRVLLCVESVADRIEAHPQPLRHLVIARRTLRSDATLKRLPSRSAVLPLVRQGVVGVDLYQGMEFLLRRGMRDVVEKWRPLGARLISCAAPLRHAQVWELQLGLDGVRNWAALDPLFAIRH